MQLEEILKEIGFTEYKAKVYKTLLFLGIASSATVAKESGVPQTKAHGILNELVKEGFAIMIPGRPTRFKAIPPSSAVVPIIEEKIKKANKLKEMVENAEENLVAKEFPKREILLFQGWNIIRKIYRDDKLDSKKEMLLFVRFGKPDPEIIQAIEKTAKLMKEVFNELWKKAQPIK
jgi:sugar-specific transcriptional regulator TrmB